MKTTIQALLWLTLTACLAAWIFALFLLAASSGSPHFQGSGWSPAKIDDYKHSLHLVTLAVAVLPCLMCLAGIGLWLLRKRRPNYS